MKKYRVIKDENGNITECHALGLVGIPILTDENGFLLYDYDEEKDEFVLKIKTLEQIEAKRKQEIVKGIRERYSINDEIALTKDAINALMDHKKIDQEYLDMEEYREQVKSEIAQR